MTQLSDDSIQVLEKCRLDGLDVPLSEQRLRGSIPDARTLPARRIGYRCGREDENARLLPVIESLLGLIDAQAEALKHIKGEVDCEVCRRCYQAESLLAHDEVIAREALAHKTEVLKGLAK